MMAPVVGSGRCPAWIARVSNLSLSSRSDIIIEVEGSCGREDTRGHRPVATPGGRYPAPPCSPKAAARLPGAASLDEDSRRLLVRRQLAAADLTHIVLREARTRCHVHLQDDFVLPHRVGLRVDGGSCDPLVPLDHPFQLARVDVEAGTGEHGLEQTDEADEAVGLLPTEVAGAQPASPRRWMLPRGTVEIAREHVLATHADLSDFAGWQGLAMRVQDGNLHPGNRPAEGSRPVGRVRGIEEANRTRFGE